MQNLTNPPLKEPNISYEYPARINSNKHFYKKFDIFSSPLYFIITCFSYSPFSSVMRFGMQNNISEKRIIDRRVAERRKEERRLHSRSAPERRFYEERRDGERRMS